ncbi:MFS general substrate transporter [Laetiporus sulphureus 93-53]|uniref:MFS general substrate transporter n=1 Tax=Laetiporus sulphureus 93-53 TaxID=1314785 RepID=A0A165ELX2_9APHY|nr:MFS general substrate transporter [Laetiporus sulphureus 93-53]KZT07332.1 MFS general substrate transporter [Laetiporus sulphureus 93-53]
MTQIESKVEPIEVDLGHAHPDSIYEMSRLTYEGEASTPQAASSEETVSVPGSMGSETTVQELSPIDGGWKAWRFCAAGFMLEVMTWGFEFSYGIFQDYYTSNPPFQNESVVSIAAVGTAAIAIQYVETIFLSLFFERYPDYLKASVWVGLAIAFASLLIASFSTKLWHLILLQGVCYGISGGLLYFPILVLLPQWFVRRRGLATGVIFAGSGVGGFAFPFLLQALLEKYGFRWTLRIWAIVTLVVVGVAILGFTPRLPVPKFQRGQRPRFIPPQMQFLKTPLFWAISVTTVLQALSYFSVSLYIATYTKVMSTAFSASIVLALFNSSGVVFQVLIGHLCDRLPYTWIMFFSTLGSGLSVFLLWGFARTLPLVFVFAIIFGGLMGGYNSVGPIAAADCAGSKPEQSSIIWALSFALKGVASVVGPLVSGVLYSVGKSSPHASELRYGAYGFQAVEIFVGVCAVATSLSSIAVAATRGKVQVPP